MSERVSMDVDFGTVSVGDQTASLGVTFEKSKLGLERADELLCGSRLAVTIIPGGKGTDPDQQQIPGSFENIEAEIDSKNYSVKPDSISARLTFNRSSINLAVLTSLVKRSGKLKIKRIGDAETTEQKRSRREELHPDVEMGKDKPHGTPGLFHAAKELKRRGKDEGWTFEISTLGRKPLKSLCAKRGEVYDGEGLTEGQLESLQSTFGIKGPLKVAELEKVISEDAFWHRKVKGFGEQKIDMLTDAVMKFRQCCPIPTDEEIEEAEAKSEADEKIDAYKAGCEASADAKPMTDNPFPEGSELSQAWAKGWTETDKQGGPSEDAGTVLEDAEVIDNPNADQDERE